MKNVKLLLLFSILTYSVNSLKIKNKVKYSNFLVGISEEELEKQSHSINLRYNDLLNVFTDKNYSQPSPNLPQTKTNTVKLASTQSAAVRKPTQEAKPSTSINISNDEIDLWDA